MRDPEQKRRPLQRFDGKAAIVTGGAHGIGLATALRLADEGARVAIVDLQAIDSPGTERGEIATWVADVADEAAVGTVVAAIEERFGPVDVLVNNAALLVAGDALDVTVEEWRRTFTVNVEGLLHMTRAVLPGMVARGTGAIVNTASVGGLFGVGGLSAYAASKGAIVNTTRQMATDFRGRGVRINCVCPGWVPTGFNDPMLAGVSDEEVAQIVATTVPAGRQGDPAEIAAAIAFLASDDASYVSGHALVVDGGLTAAL